ncbi:MAG: amidohydrolase [Defluviitaleaceae bacterium]|nr:amidohydrolase [Defluviitaleaceae bacterium]
MDILFKNATVVTMNPAAPVLSGTDVGINGRKIAYISGDNGGGESTTLPSPSTAARTIDCTGKVLMPGLYNCHAHAAMTMFRGYANDRNLEDWLFNYIFPAERKWTPELIRIGTTLAAAEMIASGTISFTDMYFFMDVVARVADEAGMLANVSNAVIGFDKDTYDFHKDNVYDQTLRAIAEYHNKKDGRVKIDASIHGVYTSHPPAWKQVMDFTHKHGLAMHIHLSETKTEHEGCIKTYGKTPARVFYEHGVLDVPTLAAHGVWITEDDMEILAEKGVTVAHNPLSNLKLASGLAPVVKMRELGVNVALGTDGVSSNNSHDLFEELKMASLLQKYATGDPTALPAMEALAMATTNGAKAQGRGHESGKIAEGYDADMLLIDFNNPRQTVCYDPALNLAYSTGGRDVEMTICRGRVLYEKGEFRTIDIEKTLHDAREAQKIFLNS